MGEDRWCFVDGTAKEHDKFTRQGWFCRKESLTEKMMGAMNIQRSLSLLHDECEALILEMECMKTLSYKEMVFTIDCSQLVKMVSVPKERIWKNFIYVRNFSLTSAFYISRGKITQWLTSLHKVLRLSLLLWFMLIRFHWLVLRLGIFLV